MASLNFRNSHKRVERMLKRGYRLAFDRDYHFKRDHGKWWLTCGHGPIIACAESIAHRLLETGAVTESHITPDIVYFKIA